MTTDEYVKAISMRTSRRTYKRAAMSKELKAVIKQMADSVNAENDDITFTFIEDPTFAFSMFTGKFSAIAVCGEDTPQAREKCGYWGETIVLQAVYHGLGTCWVDSSYNENKIMEYLQLPHGLRLYCLITFGLVNEKKSRKEVMMYNMLHRTNKPYQKMFSVCDEKLPPAYKNGMLMVDTAPSATNNKPVTFKYENGVLSGSVEEPYSVKSVSFGIAQLHFMLGAAAMGVKGRWVDDTFVEDGANKVLKFPKKEQPEEGEETEQAEETEQIEETAKDAAEEAPKAQEGETEGESPAEDTSSPSGDYDDYE